MAGSSTWTVERAAAFARFVHVGQVDKLGDDYYDGHVRDVCRRVKASGGDETAQVVALLHDVAEDWPGGDVAMISALAALGLPGEVLASVRALTHVARRESRDAYYERVLSDPIARVVKAADIASNSDPLRVARLRDDDREQLAEKYDHARKALGLVPAEAT